MFFQFQYKAYITTKKIFLTNTHFYGRPYKILWVLTALAAARIWGLRSDRSASCSSSLFQLWVWLLYCLISELAWYQNIWSHHGYKCCGSRWDHRITSSTILTDLIWMFCLSYATELQTPRRARSWTERCWRWNHQESLPNKHGWRVFKRLPNFP